MNIESLIKPLKIGALTTVHNLLLAPLAGISDYPFRQICREFGANLTFTEMVSVDGLFFNNSFTKEISKIRDNDRPIGLQLFGGEPDSFERILTVIDNISPDLVDLNFGCPVHKVVKRGGGAALLKDLNRIEKIVSILKQLHLPISAKIRIGWDANQIVALEVAHAVVSGGANAITVHGRTRNQGYSGKANWEQIAKVKEGVKIPVIGNGDVFNAQTARQMFETTNVDGIMLARGSLGRPWIFEEILTSLQNKQKFVEPDFETRIQILMRHYRHQITIYDEKTALNRMKKQLIWYTKGIPYAARVRQSIFHLNSIEDILNILNHYFSFNITNLLSESPTKII
jgi:tRNA-dihydrouridine synthase B